MNKEFDMSDLAKEVWANLSAVALTGKSEKKGRFTYLSWTWAWAELMKSYPESNYQFNPDEYLPDGSCIVSCALTVSKGDHSITRSMWLAVMDNQNKSVIKPSATDINKARMRCLVKAMAMFGLGHYIYAGEDLPEVPEVEPELISETQAQELRDLAEKHGVDIAEFCKKGDIPMIEKLESNRFSSAKGYIASQAAA